jgi:hypothetical protein
MNPQPDQPTLAAISANLAGIPAVWLLVGLAMVLRLVCVFVFYDPARLNAWNYGPIADSLLAGRGFYGGAWYVQPAPTSFMPPLYPLLLAGGRLAFPSAPNHLILILQSIAGAATVRLAFGFFRRFAPAPVALLGAALIAVHPLLVYFCGQLLPSVLATAMIFAGWWAVDLALSGRSWRAAVGAGLIVGVGALLEPTTLFGYPGLVLHRLARDWRSCWLQTLVIGVFALLAISPWIARNARVLGRFVPIKSNMGLNLWQGNNPHASGAIYLADGRDVMDLLPAEQIAAFAEMTELEMDDWFRRRALEFIVEHPAAATGLYLRKLLCFYHPYPGAHFRAIGPNFDMGRFPLLRPAIFALVFLTAGAGIVLALRAGHPIGVPLVILLSAPLFFAFFHLDNHRYRFPYEHLLLFFSAFPIQWLFARKSAGR